MNSCIDELPIDNSNEFKAVMAKRRTEKSAKRTKKKYKPGHEPGKLTIIDCRGLNIVRK